MEKLRDLIFYAVAAAFLYIALRMFEIGPIAFGFVGVPCGILAGLILSQIIGPKIGKKIAFGIYCSSDTDTAPPPSEFPEIRSKISKGDYSSAAEDLKTFIRKNPGNTDSIEMLAELFMDKMDSRQSAIDLLEAYLKNKAGRVPDDKKLVMRLADAYIESGDTASALDTLEREQAKNYPSNEKLSIRKRLKYLKQSICN